MLFVCLALVGLLAFQQWLHHQKEREHAQERRLLVTRIQSPELAPILAPRPTDDGEPEGYREEDEIMAVVRGEAFDE